MATPVKTNKKTDTTRDELIAELHALGWEVEHRPLTLEEYTKAAVFRLMEDDTSLQHWWNRIEHRTKVMYEKRIARAYAEYLEGHANA